MLGAVIVPGLRGIATDKTITRWEQISAGLAYMMGLLLAGLLITGVFDLSRSRKVGIGPRALLMLGAPGLLYMLVPAFARPLSPVASLIMAVATLFVVIGGAASGLRASHTRAIALGQLVLAFAAFSRIFGWILATIFADSIRAYTISRTFTVAGIVAEGGAQMLLVAWLSTRRKMSTSIATAIAVVAAFLVVWFAVRADASSPSWQVVLRSGIGGQVSPGSQATLGALEAFFVTASMLLALVCAVMQTELAVIMCAIALALLGRGAFDVPLRALAAAVAALWTTLAAVDERAMWKALSKGRQ